MSQQVEYGALREDLAFDPNGLALWAGFLGIGCLSYWIIARSLWARLSVGSILLVSLLTLAISFSRAGQLCFAVGLVTWFLLMRQSRMAGLVLVGSLVGLLLVEYGDYFGARWFHTAENLDEAVGVTQVGSRVDNWLKTWEAAKQNLLFGLGGRNYVRYLEEQYTYAFRSHNEYLEILAETGLVGLAAYLILLANLIIWARKIRLTTREEPVFQLSSLLLTWMVMLCLFSISGSLAMAGNRAVPLFVLIGALASAPSWTPDLSRAAWRTAVRGRAWVGAATMSDRHANSAGTPAR